MMEQSRKSSRIRSMPVERCKWKGGGAYGDSTDDTNCKDNSSQTRKGTQQKRGKGKQSDPSTTAPKLQFNHSDDYDKSDKMLPPSQPLYSTPPAMVDSPTSEETHLEETSTQSTKQQPAVQTLADKNEQTSHGATKDGCDRAVRDGPTTEESYDETPIIQTNPVVFVNTESIDGIQIDNAIAKDSFEFLDPTIRANLPPYKKAERINKDYNGINKFDLFSLISNTYEDIVTWKKNLFKLPSGKCGREFIKLMTDWLQKYNSDSTFQCIAMKVVRILPNMLLQKPSATSKSKDHTKSS